MPSHPGRPRSIVRLLCGLLVAWAAAAPARAQPEPAPPDAEPALRRWIDVQTFTIYTRYRFTRNSEGVTTANQLQYKDTFQARLNLDPDKRYSVTLGYGSGGSFISSWNNWGVGHRTDFTGSDHYLKQLFASAAPIQGLELQYGGLFLNRGDGDEWLTYDDDGYVLGERASVRRPGLFYLDEITVTRGAIGPLTTPSLLDRRRLLTHPDYTQVLGLKRLNAVVTASAEYNRLVGGDMLRAAATFHLPAGAPINTVRYEQYRRFNEHPAAGFGLWADRSLSGYVRVQGGYATVDQFYGGWNADRMQDGRRFFANATVRIYGPIAASAYWTHALGASYTVPIHRRFDVVVSYDVLNLLRRTGRL